ncbi:MAG: F0F1 ATP synthase subunit B [Chloroflexi bacterium]|nr:F0F1 ATP synthase subunit B [Chloroflexota bacterium]
MEKFFEGLGISVSTLLAQTISFGVLLGLLYLVAYKPVLKMLDERSRRIRDSMEQAEKLKEQTARSEEEVKKQVQAARAEGQEIVARAMKSAEEVRLKAQQEARQDGEQLIARARAEIQRERDGAIDELRQEFADLTILAAEKVIDRTLDKKAHRDIIDKVLAEAPTLKKG